MYSMCMWMLWGEDAAAGSADCLIPEEKWRIAVKTPYSDEKAVFSVKLMYAVAWPLNTSKQVYCPNQSYLPLNYTYKKEVSVLDTVTESVWAVLDYAALISWIITKRWPAESCFIYVMCNWGEKCSWVKTKNCFLSVSVHISMIS